MVKDVIDFLIQQDPQVGNAVKAEYDRQRRNIELIASENFVSEAVLAAAVSAWTWWKTSPGTGPRPSSALTT